MCSRVWAKSIQINKISNEQDIWNLFTISRFLGLLEIKDWPNYCFIWGFITFTRLHQLFFLCLWLTREVINNFNHTCMAYAWWILIPNWKLSKHNLKPFFSPFRSLSKNNCAEINSFGNFKLLKVPIIGLSESVAQFSLFIYLQEWMKSYTFLKQINCCLCLSPQSPCFERDYKISSSFMFPFLLIYLYIYKNWATDHHEIILI